MKKSNLFYLVLLSLLMIFTSCEKEDKTPGYIGVWEMTNSITEDGITLNMKDVLTLEEGNFIESIQMKYGDQYLEILVMKGDLVATETKFSFTITSIGALNSNTLDMDWYNEGTDAFDSFLREELQYTTNSYSIAYSVEGKVLILKSDMNGDGVISDSEKLKYTKVED
jgi:hypothetical protein